MHSINQSYEVEWETKDGSEIRTLVVWARSASQAEDKAEAKLKSNPKFGKIEHVELYP